MALAAGTKAPDFKLFNTDKKEVSLSDFAGKNLIIHFFPAAFTGVCTEQLCSSRDDLAFYNGLNASVVGVSVDMLSDFNKLMIHNYDMYFPNFAFGFKGVAKRGVVLIDKDGVIQYSEETKSPGDQVNFEALKAAVEKLK